jgi:hypothetical protein
MQCLANALKFYFEENSQSVGIQIFCVYVIDDNNASKYEPHFPLQLVAMGLQFLQATVYSSARAIRNSQADWAVANQGQ